MCCGVVCESMCAVGLCVSPCVPWGCVCILLVAGVSGVRMDPVPYPEPTLAPRSTMRGDGVGLPLDHPTGAELLWAPSSVPTWKSEGIWEALSGHPGRWGAAVGTRQTPTHSQALSGSTGMGSKRNGAGVTTPSQPRVPDAGVHRPWDRTGRCTDRRAGTEVIKVRHTDTKTHTKSSSQARNGVLGLHPQA